MILNICYNDKCVDFLKEITNLCLEEFPDIKILQYDENHYKDKKKAYKIKGGYSARMTPFMLLTNNEKKYIKAFYSEDKGCTLDNLKQFLNNYYESTSN